MIVVNTETVPGMRIARVMGIAQGSAVRVRHLVRDVAALFRKLFGGEPHGDTRVMDAVRREAIERMSADAGRMEANAVVNVRFSTSSVTQGAAELYCYGTAVVVQPAGV